MSIMARYLLDTNIFTFLATQQEDNLSHDVSAILSNYENEFLMSIESVRELIVAHRSGKLISRYFKSAEQVIDAIERLYAIRIVLVDKAVMRTLAGLEIDVAGKHFDPSDHVIIAHAMTLRIPLISSDTKFPFYRKQGLDLIENI